MSYRYHYTVSVWPVGRPGPLSTSRAYSRRDDAERLALHLAAETGEPAEVWASRPTRVGRQVTGTAHGLVFRVAGADRCRARDMEIGLDVRREWRSLISASLPESLR